VWQQPLDFLQAGAWPASLSDRLKTVVQSELLQQWDSHRLCNPAATLTGFLAGLQHAAAVGSNMPVSPDGGSMNQHLYLLASVISRCEWQLQVATS